LNQSTSKAIATVGIWLPLSCTQISLFNNLEKISGTRNENAWLYLAMLLVVCAAVGTRFVWKGGSGE